MIKQHFAGILVEMDQPRSRNAARWPHEDCAPPIASIRIPTGSPARDRNGQRAGPPRDQHRDSVSIVRSRHTRIPHSRKVRIVAETLGQHVYEAADLAGDVSVRRIGSVQRYVR